MRLELTRRTDYAIRAMLTLARHRDETLSSADISARTNIPVRFVTQVMSNLVRAGLVHAVIGRSGGYRLLAKPETVSVLSIVDAVEGDTRRQHCVLRGGPCQNGQPCEIHSVFAGAQDAFHEHLATSSLATIIDQSSAATQIAELKRARRLGSTRRRCAVWPGTRPPGRAAAG